MKKILKTIGKIALIMLAITIGAWLVIFYPAIAIAFMAVGVVKYARNPYEAVLFSAAASIVAGFLILNVAELAIVATTLSVQDAAQQWTTHVATA